MTTHAGRVARKPDRNIALALLLVFLTLDLIALLAPTRIAIACPPPGIFATSGMHNIACMSSVVHIWDAAWWTGRSQLFGTDQSGWWRAAFIAEAILLLAAIVVVGSEAESNYRRAHKSARPSGD